MQRIYIRRDPPPRKRRHVIFINGREYIDPSIQRMRDAKKIDLSNCYLLRDK